MSLEDLRSKAYFQNTIDVWIMYCGEKMRDWYDVEEYKAFVDYLKSNGIKMQKFPLCIKESGGMFERGRDKTKFLEELSQYNPDEAGAYTLKLSADVLSTIRGFDYSKH